MEPVIHFKDFTFKYRAQTEPTLYDINLDIYPGQKVLIVGPSGSGKSTLSNCINGLVPFCYAGDISGEYSIGGKDPKTLGIFGLSKIVGTVLQDSDSQFVGLSVAEDIAFVLENDCVEQSIMRQKVSEVASRVEVESLLSHAPSELSGGQKQRVSMAGVMIDDVEVLLFDEPLANLDPATGKNAIALIDDISKDDNKTIIIIEHRLEDALYSHIDRIVVVNEGRIVADDTPDNILCSDVLINTGIREPLYITALKYAGCKIEPEDRPWNIKCMNLDNHKQRVKEWFCQVKKEEPAVFNESILRVENLEFSYTGKRKVLSDISFDIKRGQMVSIVGKNGAGKSTLTNLICGFLKPDSGRIILNNEDISKLSIKERGQKIGLVMQSPNQMISKAMIYEEVSLGLALLGVEESKIKEKVDSVLKICGLYPFRNWPISALSFGQKKRVCIAAILAMEPEILLLDEPTAGQDYKHYTEIMEFLKELHEKMGLTIVMITHDMHLMLEYTDRAIVIADGKLLADTTGSRVLTNEELTKAAYLKKTSLYDLAVCSDIDDPVLFVDSFINEERRKRSCHEC